jgi:hypothetical protein
MAQEILSPQSSSDLGKEEIIDLLSSDEDVDDSSEKVITDTEAGNEPKAKEDKKDKEDAEETEDEETEDKEPEIKLDEESELQYFNIPKRQEILKQFPELFKKFPTIERAIYGNQQFREIFPTIQDAKEAQERVQDYEKFESTLLNGNVGDILKSVKNTDERAFNKITNDYLGSLYRVDPQAHGRVVSVLVGNLAQLMYNSGRQNNNENVKAAAQILNQWAFPNGQAPVQQPVQNNEAENSLRREREGFVRQQYDVALEDVSNRAMNTIKAAVEDHIDRKGMMTDYVKRNAINDVMGKIREAVETDTGFKSLLDKLWTNAFNNNFSQDSKNKLRNALLSKARTVLPGIINNVKTDALKGQAARNGKNKDDDRSPLPKGAPVSRERSEGNKKAGEIPRGMKTIDYLMQD